MDIQLLHLTTFNGYRYSIIYLFVSVINNYSQNISFANSSKMQNKAGAAAALTSCAAEKRPSGPKTPPLPLGV